MKIFMEDKEIKHMKKKVICDALFKSYNAIRAIVKDMKIRTLTCNSIE